MRPNVEEIRQRLQQIEDRTIDSRTEWCVHLALQKLPEALAYIDELENMPLLQTIAEQKQEIERIQQDYQTMYERALEQHNEIERLREALKSIAGSERHPFDWWSEIARQALEGESHGTV